MIFEHRKIESLDDYFVGLSKRKETSVYFYRINGISDEVRQFLCKYYEAARNSGVIIEGKISNPTEDNLSYYHEIMGMDFKMEDAFINASLKKWLPRMNDKQRNSITKAIYYSLDKMSKQGKTENMIKNAYIKYMCWLYYKFERIVNQLGNEIVPKILYEGSISNYELKLVAILSNAGCDVVLVQKDQDQAYQKLDMNSEISDVYSGNTTNFDADFLVRKLVNEAREKSLSQPVTTALNSSEPARTSVQRTTVQSNLVQRNPVQSNSVQRNPVQRNSVQTNPVQNNSGLHINVSRTTSKPATTDNNHLDHKGTNGSGKVSLGPVIRCTNAWIEGKGLSDILQATTIRGKDSSLFYNCYCRINGVVDRLTYANELYQFYLSLKNAKRYVAIANNGIKKPAVDEIATIKRSNYVRLEQLIAGLRANIQYPSNLELQKIMIRAFEEIITEESQDPNNNINKLVNKAVYLLCWLKRYQSELFNNWKKGDIGCFILFGGCKDNNEAMFMRFLARLPVDILILCPNLNEKCCLEDRELYEINYENSMVMDAFPAQNSQMHIATAAYHAERDLDKIMYNDSVIFRDQQFTKANTILLQTMDREIKILWNNDIKFRPNFSTIDGIVNMPVIFSKLSGVKDNKIDEYWISIKQLITEETMVIDHVPLINPSGSNPIKMYATEFYKNGKLQRNKIKNHPCYQYGFLREDMQEHILDKLEMMIEQNLIKGTHQNGTEYTIISVALSLPKFVIRLIQKFDFTKKNPKLIYINTTESLITLEDTIFVTLLNLIGFDVVFYVPTGYNMEGHFNKQLMEEHQLGDYVYDLQVPNWQTVPLTASKKWRDKLFKKG